MVFCISARVKNSGLLEGVSDMHTANKAEYQCHHTRGNKTVYTWLVAHVPLSADK